ncbi:MAG TPA: DUF1501 domain-containing protein [Azospirillaceae bacterium]|nr:DUF1501 domain-containing protein [Azospirillaceae bacterium]
MTIDHPHPSRRDLLRGAFWTGVGGVAALTLPPGLALAADTGVRWDRTLVAFHFGGGNDGLNTVVPYADPAYARLRPRIAIPRDQVVPLTEQLGLHPALAPLREAWNDGRGDLAIGLGVGYPRQNRSHFRSIEIWETGSESEQVLTDGWIGRLFDRADPPAALAADGVILSGSGLSVMAPGTRRIALPASGDLSTPDLVARIDPAAQAASLGHVMRTQADLAQAAATFRGVNATPLPVAFPQTAIGRLLEQSARIIVAGKPVPVIMISQGSYDTHAGQLDPHRRLLGELAAGLVAFRNCLMLAGKWDSVTFMSFAEFGRRAAENGSQGTDHGAASCHFLMGGGVRGGFFGQQPSLTDLEGGDLRHSVDFRRIYASVAREFWAMPAATAEAAIGAFAPLDLYRAGGA